MKDEENDLKIIRNNKYNTFVTDSYTNKIINDKNKNICGDKIIETETKITAPAKNLKPLKSKKYSILRLYD